MAKKRILVACGTGIATSTMVAKKVEEALKARGYDVLVEQCKAAEAPSKASNYDLIVSTTTLQNCGSTPVIRSIAFLSGVGVDKDIEKIVAALGDK